MKTTSILPTNIWAHALIAWFALFIAAVIVFIAFAIRHPMSLVTQNYYEEEVLYQKRMDSIARTQALSGAVSLSYQAGANSISLSLPADHAKNNAVGHIQLYRPSDARLDRRIRLALDANGNQQIDVTTLQPGLWKVQVQWRAGNQDYFLDRSIVTGSTAL